MELNKAIQKVWNQHQESYLPDNIQDSAYAFYENYNQKDLLVLGLNPFYGKVEKHLRSIKYNVEDLLKFVTSDSYLYEQYFKRIQKTLKHPEFSIDLTSKMAYTDLFYYRTNEREATLNLLLKCKNGFHFLQDQLKITQQLIEEVIQPKVIITTYLEVASFLGIAETKDAISSLNYVFELVDKTKAGYRVYEIKGFKDGTDKQTNLLGTRVICNPYSSSESTFCLQADEILKEILTVNKFKNTPTSKRYLDVAYDIFIQFPLLYKLQKTVALKAVDEEVILNLKMFKHLPVKESAIKMFFELSQLDILNEKTLKKLTSSTYCHKKFGVENALLKEVNEKPQNSKSPYFSLPNTTFVFETNWEKGSYPLLEKWYVSKIYKHFKRQKL